MENSASIFTKVQQEKWRQSPAWWAWPACPVALRDLQLLSLTSLFYWEPPAGGTGWQAGNMNTQSLTWLYILTMPPSYFLRAYASWRPKNLKWPQQITQIPLKLQKFPQNHKEYTHILLRWWLRGNPTKLKKKSLRTPPFQQKIEYKPMICAE